MPPFFITTLSVQIWIRFKEKAKLAKYGRFVINHICYTRIRGIEDNLQRIQAHNHIQDIE